MRARLQQLDVEVGLPIDPPDQNLNSRLALATAELVRAKSGDGAAGAFHHDFSRAFFTQSTDISKPHVVIPIAEGYGVCASDADGAWQERRFRRAVDVLFDPAKMAGVTGKVAKPTFLPCLEIPQATRDSHFPTASAAAGD